MNLVFSLLFFLFGTAIGSFINAASFRIGHGKNWISGRSACQKCQHQLKWWELIPVISFFLLKAKCSSCKESIASRYLLVELVMGALFLVAGQSFLLAFDYWTLLFELVLSSSLVFLFLHDLEFFILPDLVTIPSLIVLFGLQLLRGYSVQELLLAILIGAGFFAFQFIISKGKWIGGGDIRMGALMGSALSWPGILIGLFLSYIYGSVIAIYLLATKKKSMGAKLPFGTFLALGTLTTLWYGDAILTWYLGFL